MNRHRRGGSRLEKNQPQKSGPIQPGQEEAAPQEARRGGMPRWAKILLIVLAVLAAVAIVLFAVYKTWAVLPEIQPPASAEQTADPDTGILPPQNPMRDYPRKEGFYTFLVAGRDTGGGGNTDTMMLVAYDIPNQKLSVMSLPRDTMVDARHPDHNRKLNGVWNLGLYYAKKDSKKEGIEYLKEAVGDMMGFVPDFYVVVNWEAFGRLVDAIGGVEFEVPFNMEYRDPAQDLYINVPKGKRVLTGQEAMGVVRWRHNNSLSMGYATGDLGRIETQQALMKEVVKKCLKVENVTKINEFSSIFVEEVQTDLTIGNLVAFAERAIFGGLKMDNVTFTTMPNTPVTVRGESYVQANPEELLGLLNDSFNPYKEDLTMDALHILQYKSSTGYYTYSGTGTGKAPIYTDPKPAAVVTTPEPTPKPTAEPSESPDASEVPEVDGSPAPEGSEAPDASADPQTGEQSDSSDRPDDSDAPDGEEPTGSEAPSDESTEPTQSPAEGSEDEAGDEPAAPSDAPAQPPEAPAASDPANEVPAGIPMD